MYAAVDLSSNQTIVSSAVAAAGACKPIIVSTQFSSIIYYIDSLTKIIYAKSFLLSPNISLGAATQITSSTPGASSTLSSSVGKMNYDACIIGAASGERVALSFANDAGGITVRSYDSSSVLGSFGVQQISSISPDSLSLSDYAGSVGICFTVTTTAYQSSMDAFATSAPSSPITLGATTLGVFVSIASEAISSSNTSVFATSFDSVSGRIKTTIYKSNLLATTSSLDVLGVGLSSKCWVYEGRDIVARTYYGSASGLPSSSGTGAPVLPAISLVSESLFQVPALEATRLQTSVGDIQSTFGVSSLSVDFLSSPVSDNRSEIGGSLVLGGGIVTQYDGQKNVELGFNVWPDELSATLGSGGSLSAGSYQWVAVYEWTDQQGYVHRSAASLPVTATATVGQQATLTASNLTITKKHPGYGRDNCSIVIYRTLANGSIFHRASSVTAPTANSVSSFTTVITDGLSDVDLESRPLLYSTGGTVENVVYAPMRSLASHRARLFGIDSINPLTIWYSRQITPNAPVEFSDSFSLMVDNRGGEITALASLDDKLIVFKRNLIMMISGQGPDALGGQNDFSDAMLVTSDCGCIDAKSIVTVPDGVMFQSAKGIYLLDRSLKAEYIGSNVESYNGEQVVSAQLVPTTNQVRFIMSSGVALVYDYYVKQWSVFTNHPAVDTVIWLDRFCWLRADGVAMREDPSRHDDDGSFVSMKATTAWIDFSTDAGQYIAAMETRMPMTLQGFQRAYKVMLLGEYISAHKLKVQIAYDFKDVYTQETVVEAPQMLSPSIYGESSTYGSESPYGGEWQLYQWRIDLARQKCQSVKVSISDVQVGDAVGESVRLSALAFDLGLKPGLNRVPMSSVLG